MAAIFNTPFGANGNAGNWLALPALPTGTHPMREVVITCSAAFFCGTCSAGQATSDSGFFFFDAGRHSLGVVDYTKITIRNVGTSGATIFSMSFAATDNGPEGN